MLKSDRAHGWPGKAARDWPHPAAEDQGKTFPINELLRASECINGASGTPHMHIQRAPRTLHNSGRATTCEEQNRCHAVKHD